MERPADDGCRVRPHAPAASGHGTLVGLMAPLRVIFRVLMGLTPLLQVAMVRHGA